MNLHGLVAGAIGAVNPSIDVWIKKSIGYRTEGDGKQVPCYVETRRKAQVQPLTGSEIERLNNLGIQGILRAAHLDGNWQGIVRPLGKGGDLLRFNGQDWLVVQVLETWPDWCRIAICLQQ